MSGKYWIMLVMTILLASLGALVAIFGLLFFIGRAFSSTTMLSDVLLSLALIGGGLLLISPLVIVSRRRR